MNKGSPQKVVGQRIGFDHKDKKVVEQLLYPPSRFCRQVRWIFGSVGLH